MCGILGQYFPTAGERSTGSRERTRTAQRLLGHRGPDDRGLVEIPLGCGTLLLGHTRLSIIDLSAGGHQPMRSSDGQLEIVFNGEIYNYRELRDELRVLGHVFTTQSDTEVLLAAWREWREAGLQRLNGMFAFVVVDRAAGTMTLVRDPFGIKPLYYHLGSGAVCFASEIPALCALLPQRPNPNLGTAYAYLSLGAYDNSPQTFFDGVHQLRPAHMLQVDLPSMQITALRRWWQPPIVECIDTTFTDAKNRLRELFINSVKLHLRSDVPVGAALSGGIDSSAIVCAMRLAEPDMPLHTFTFVTPGTAMDEERWADLVNAHVGAIAHKVEVSPRRLGEELDDLIRAQGEPFGSTSIYAQYRVYQAAREAGVVVTLDGQGADELLAGYDGFPAGAIESLLEQRRFAAALTLVRGWSAWPNRTLFRGIRSLASAARSCWWPQLAAVTRLPRNSTPPWIDAGRCKDLGLARHAAQVRGSREGVYRRLVERLRSALTENGLAALLRHGDRNSMHWSIESRVPFLTTEIAEFCLSLPRSTYWHEAERPRVCFEPRCEGSCLMPYWIAATRLDFEPPKTRG